MTSQHLLLPNKQLTRLSRAKHLTSQVYITNKLTLENMSTARLSGKTLDDVLYPAIDPHKTGMLQVGVYQASKIRNIYPGGLR